MAEKEHDCHGMDHQKMGTSYAERIISGCRFRDVPLELVLTDWLLGAGLQVEV